MWQLYVIVDRHVIGSRDPIEVASAAIQGGADVLQLRDKLSSDSDLLKDARRLRALTQASSIPFILNDRVAIAAQVGADGVHVGQEDMPIAEARKQLAPGTLIGKSTHTLEQALAAGQEGADYLGCGPIFSTPTKPAYGCVGTALITQVMARVTIPVVCIGGIEPATLNEALQAGARCVAVVRAVCAAPDPEAATRGLKTIIRNTPQFIRTGVVPPL